MGKELITLPCPIAIRSCATVVGKQEKEGPLGQLFDAHDLSDKFGQKTWEQAESEMQHMALNLAMSKCKQNKDGIDLLFAGDLLNQCVGSAYGLLPFQLPFFGLYGACSTAAEGLILASLLLQTDFYDCIATVASSHYCASERQFRFPLEYGGQRTPTSQWTVTGAGAFLLEKGRKELPCITEVLPGRSIDLGITDGNNMGAAMAPAAADTVTRYFAASVKKPEDFDLIITGDLGWEGYNILTDLLAQQSIKTQNLGDCGLLIYDRKKQDKHAGGSGCGCSAIVLAGYLYPKLLAGELKHILWIGTGALMSPASVQQGESIPGIAHLVHLQAPQTLL